LTQAAPVRLLPIAMIEPSLGTPLVASVGGSPLLAAGMFAALGTAVAVSAVTVRADEENRLAALTKANPLPQNRFAVNHRHASSQAWTGQRQWSRGRLEPALFGSPVDGCRTRNPAARTAGFLYSRLETRYCVQRSLWDDRTDDCAFGAMMSLALRRKFRKLRFQMIADSSTSAGFFCRSERFRINLSRTVFAILHAALSSRIV
jgi:hypothetical protein